MMLGALLVLLGTPFVFYNWYVFYRVFIKKRNISWIPFVGGGCLALGFYLLQKPFWWLFFFVDFGCIPGFLYNFLLYKWIDPWVRKINKS